MSLTKCPKCGQRRGQVALESHMNICRVTPETVKRVDLFGNVTDTFRSEAELNGFAVAQGRML